ncbi:NACHT, LRR and PYD domains-containing protein 1a allele 5-like isoform X2 [Dendropsophus ebraccatus]|uniref:NACHT, LRR and PYD domains-containing protein 1a allele 5-like isoform X2 n=1 Tax=Dendropsophus ebraccatus TaxID=150705 RepID=UPI0038317A92
MQWILYPGFICIDRRMASSKPGEDVTCCICRNPSSDPVSLPCGHSFCPLCVTESPNTQDQDQLYTCPQCGKRPTLQRNTELRKEVAERRHPLKKSLVPYTYSINPPPPATEACLQVSLCLVLEAEKYPNHNQPQEHYCPQDSAGIYGDCGLLGGPRKPPERSLYKPLTKKKPKYDLRKVPRQKETRTTIQRLQKMPSIGQGEESQVEEEIYIMKIEVSEYCSNQTMADVQEMLHMTDPLPALQHTGGCGEAAMRKGGHRNKGADPDLILGDMFRSVSALLTDNLPTDVKYKSLKDVEEEGATNNCLYDGTMQEVDAVLDSKALDSASFGNVTSANTKVYRLRLTSAGRHICPETGIQFVVKGPVVLEYNVESWSSHMTDTLRSQYETVGPLFNVRIQEGPDNVSAVYLPHYLSPQCYKQYKSYIKCVHFKDNKMTLESPTRLDPCYAVLENPSFSCLGALVEKLLTLITRPFTFHGVALIYCKVDTTYSFRLYVMIDNEPRLKSAINKEIGNDFHYICKPPQMNPVSAYKDYMVQGPRGAVIEPELYPYTEIAVRDIGEEIQLSIAERSNGNIVWSRSLRREDLDKLRGVTTRSAMSGRSQRPSISDKKPCDLTIGQVLGLLSKDHFVDRHRVALIGGIPLVAPLLDDLYQYRLLTAEAYDTVRSRTTAQEQMRQLLGFVNSWGNKDKDEILRSLRSHNLPLVKNLVRKENQAKGIMTTLVVMFLIVSKFKSLKG